MSTLIALIALWLQLQRRQECHIKWKNQRMCECQWCETNRNVIYNNSFYDSCRRSYWIGNVSVCDD